MADTEHVGNVIRWSWLGPALAGFVILWMGNQWIKQGEEHQKDHTSLVVTSMQVEELKTDVANVKDQVQDVQNKMEENSIKGDARWEWLERSLPADRRVPQFSHGKMFDK